MHPSFGSASVTFARYGVWKPVYGLRNHTTLSPFEGSSKTEDFAVVAVLV